jgi:hydrogenase expression/formation protein HypE
MLVREADLPLNAEVQAACELLGLDPLYVANEGKLVAICPAAEAERLLDVMRGHPLGREAALVGEVREDAHRFVQMQTALGGSRIVDWLSGEQLPRIC